MAKAKQITNKAGDKAIVLKVSINTKKGETELFLEGTGKNTRFAVIEAAGKQFGLQLGVGGKDVTGEYIASFRRTLKSAKRWLSHKDATEDGS